MFTTKSAHNICKLFSKVTGVVKARGGYLDLHHQHRDLIIARVDSKPFTNPFHIKRRVLGLHQHKRHLGPVLGDIPP